MSMTSRTGTTTFETPSDLEIRATRTFHAPRALVFDAWTSPEHLPHWMLGPPGWTMPVCEIDLRVGGEWGTDDFFTHACPGHSAGWRASHGFLFRPGSGWGGCGCPLLQA